MKGLFLSALMLLSFIACAQSTGPIKFENSYATVVEKGTEYDASKEFYYPTTVTVDVSAKKVTFEYDHDNKNVTMTCKIFSFEMSKNETEEYTDIQTTPPNGENILFRFYDNSIFVVFSDMYLILNN